MSPEERKAVLNIVLVAVKMGINDPAKTSLYGDQGLCQIVKEILVRRFYDVHEECIRLFNRYIIEWAIKNNPQWSEYADIYVVPGQPGGGLNKLAYYEARRRYALWDLDTEYGRKRHQLLDDLIETTKEPSHVRSQDQKGSNTDK